VVKEIKIQNYTFVLI